MKVKLLFGGKRAQFGWLFAAIGVAVCAIALRDLDWPFARYGGVGHGRVIAVSETNQEVNESPTYAVDARFTDDRGRDRIARSYTEEPPSLDGDVTIDYDAEHAQIEEMRNGKTPVWLAIVAIFPIVGLALALAGTRRALRAIHLLRCGQVVQAKLVSKTTGGIIINDVPESRLTFEFVLPSGRVQSCEVRTHEPQRLEDDETETLVYD
ncbi:MAG: hypothetical protein HOV81_04495, partial [Kofleriaceae bacterium]|nr:hypothetical protein [Kofleriaceae bacterium]